MFCEVQEKLSTREDIYAVAKRILVYGVVELNIFPPRFLPWLANGGFLKSWAQEP